MTTSTDRPRAREEFIDGAEGLKIFIRSWQPEGPPKAILAICHGVNSHSGQYVGTGEAFAAAGYAVYALDLRGRGRSEGDRFFVRDVDEYVSDLGRLIDTAMTRQPGLPIFLLGHSAGGVVSTTYAMAGQSRLAGLICESFAFRVPAPKPALAIIKLVSRILPRLKVLKLKNEDFSRDPAVVARLNGDELIAGEAQPAATVAALVRADEKLERGFPSFTMPVLILHGTADKVTMPVGSEIFHRMAGSRDKTLKLYKDHAHDLLVDHGHEQVMADILGWIAARLPASRSTVQAAVSGQGSVRLA